MTNRDAINLLEEVKILDDTMYAYNPKYLDALDMALTALEAEETWYATHEYPQKPHWIPCSERLPEDGTVVLVCTEDEFMYLAERTCGHWEEITGFCSVDDTVAWLPLPEPYKGE